MEKRHDEGQYHRLGFGQLYLSVSWPYGRPDCLVEALFDAKGKLIAINNNYSQGIPHGLKPVDAATNPMSKTMTGFHNSSTLSLTTKWGSKFLILAVFAALMLGPQCSFGATFGNDPLNFSAWADTPKGRFECRDDASTDHKQTITVGSARIYQHPRSPDEPGGATLSDGIRDQGNGCPDIIANQHGYLVIGRAIQPPHYGVYGYAVIDFNDPKFPVIELGQGQYPQDTKINSAKRLKWNDKGVTLHFVGYLADVQAATTNTPPPKFHKVRFNFSNAVPVVIK